ncbi:hypothetical protein [Rothia nasimurium]|uniref:hypothetical protein n=1 Tax=Rothia nasimurium TaxID=85336 RepID=UPI003B9E7982
MTETSRPADSSPEQVPLAVRRLRKLQARSPEATPADLAERLGGIFIRDFTLVGSAQAGATELTPDLVGTVTRNRRIAGITQAATHLGAVQQGIATYNRAATTGINTTAHVGSAQAVKTYLHGIALIYGIPAATSDDAAAAVLGADVNDLLAHLNTARPETTRGQQMNILGAVAAIGLRNPQTLLLVKAGEQLVKAGGAVLASQKVRRDFARQLIDQVQQNLGAAPSQLPASTLAVLGSGQDAGTPGTGAGQGTSSSAPASDDADLLELTAEEITAIESPQPVEASEVEAPADITASDLPAPAPVAPPAEVRASTTEELAAADGATAKGARLAARAFVRARSRFKG